MRYPFVGIFVVQALIILSAYFWSVPFDLLGDTAVDYLDSTAVFRVEVLSSSRSPHSSDQRLDVRLHSMHTATQSRKLQQKAELVLRGDSTVHEVGDVLLARTCFRRYDSGFYGSYLRTQHKIGVGYVSSGEWEYIGHVPVRSLQGLATVARQRLVERYKQAGLEGEVLQVVSALTLGEKREMESSLRQSFASAGVAHVLAVSGLHTGFIFAFLMLILTVGGNRRPLYEERWKRVLLTSVLIISLWGYAFLTGLSPSVTRAVVMLSLVQIGWVLRRDSLSINTLAAAAVICMLIDPVSLLTVSFQLSFSAVLGILLIYRPLNKLFPKVKNRVVKYFIDIILLSIAATLGTLPVSLFYFGFVSRYFLLTNILVIPWVYLLVILSLTTLVFASCFLGRYIAVVVKFLTTGLCRFVDWVSDLPGATFKLSLSPTLLCVLIMLIVFMVCYIYYKRWFALSFCFICCVVFCGIYWREQSSLIGQSSITTQGRQVLICHEGVTDTLIVTDRQLFFRYDGQEFAYSPYMSTYKAERLRKYCEKEHIILLGDE